MNGRVKLFENIITYSVAALAFLTPLFFFTKTIDFYDFNKNFLLAFVVGLLLLSWAVKMFLAKTVALRRSAFDLPVLLIILSFLLSAVFATTNRFEAFLAPGGAGTVIALALLYFTITNNLKEEDRIIVVRALLSSGLVLSLITLYQFVGLGESFAPAGWDWLKAKTWTPTGSLHSLLGYLLILLALNLARVKEKTKDSLAMTMAIGLSLLFLSAIAVGSFLTFKDGFPFLPWPTGWAIAIETLKNYPLWGIGPGNFLDAFTQNKPLSFNAGDLWNSRFLTSSNAYLQLLTITGLAGLGSYLFLVLKAVGNLRKSLFSPALLALIVAFGTQIIFPYSFLSLFVVFVLLGLSSLSLEERKYEEQSKILPGVILVLVFLSVSAAFYLAGRAYLADFYAKKSFDAVSRGQGTTAYNLQIKAIRFNPYRDFYRVAYSQLNLALARSLVTGKESLSDEDKTTVTALVGQSIREGKNAIALNPRRVTNWENLAGIYRNLTSFAEGADKWTVAAYQQAITLDPFNPDLRLSLGGFYYSLKMWDEAVKEFQNAVRTKPDLANSRYNLAAAYREKGEFEKAIAEMEAVLTLVKASSDDFLKAQSELEALKTKVAQKSDEKKEEVKPETLNLPQPIPSPVIEPPIEVPDGGPEVPQPSPTPNP